MYTYDTFVPNPNMGMWGFDTLEEFSDAVPDDSLMYISRDRETLIAIGNGAYLVYNGREVIDGIAEKREGS